MLVLDLDRATAGHLAVAIRRHREALRRTGRAVPTGLAELEAMAVRAVTSERERARACTPMESATVVDDAGVDGCELLTYPQVAQRLGVHESTVRRHVKRGDLRAVPIGRARRFHPDDLDRYLNGAR